MKGSVKKRGGSWRGRADLGLDPNTGKRRIVSVTARTKKEVEDELRIKLEENRKGEYVPPSELTVAAWLDTWVQVVFAPGKRQRSVETYKSVIKLHLKPAFSETRLQQFEPEQVEEYFAARRGKLSDSTLSQHSAILFAAMKSAVRKKKIAKNPVALVESKPKRATGGHEDALRHCWEQDEARAFLRVARAAGAQPAAFYTMELELGLRKGEICGLRWEDVDLDRGTVRIVQQLVRVGAAGKREPLFGPPKGGKVRTLDISPDDVCALLAAHKKHQAEVKLRNRMAYHDHGLVFAKEGRSRSTDRIGDPLQANNLAEREFNPLVKLAGVRRIKFHGLRHTSATLALQAGVPVKVVQARLGHRRIEITMDIYAHALPSAQKDAARVMSSILRAE